MRPRLGGSPVRAVADAVSAGLKRARALPAREHDWVIAEQGEHQYTHCIASFAKARR